MKTVFIFEPTDFSPLVVDRLSSSGFLVKLNDGNTSITKALLTYEIIFLRLSVNIDRDLLDRLSEITCRFLVIPATGIDHIDEQACLDKNIKIISFKYNKNLLRDIRATAELTLALTLSLYRNLVSASLSVKEGLWNRDLFRGRDIFGKKVGIIGFGRLGRIVAEYFHILGAQIIVYEKELSGDVPLFVRTVNSLNEILDNCEIITIHVDYKVENTDLINKDNLLLMKQKPIIINTSRGQMINEEDLLWALEKNIISGAAIDVVKNELKFGSDNPLVKYSQLNQNLLITPHIGGCTIDSSHKTEEIITTELLKELNGL